MNNDDALFLMFLRENTLSPEHASAVANIFSGAHRARNAAASFVSEARAALGKPGKSIWVSNCLMIAALINERRMRPTECQTEESENELGARYQVVPISARNGSRRTGWGVRVLRRGDVPGPDRGDAIRCGRLQKAYFFAVSLANESGGEIIFEGKRPKRSLSIAGQPTAQHP